jgi:hypothetical protein
MGALILRETVEADPPTAVSDPLDTTSELLPTVLESPSPL